ncbi:MAG: hypothetical protein QOH25_741 [Acidobacteriota bacterium]|nr:hypothetical protein [Acidobacteriota bacterium]
MGSDSNKIKSKSEASSTNQLQSFDSSGPPPTITHRDAFLMCAGSFGLGVGFGILLLWLLFSIFRH